MRDIGDRVVDCWEVVNVVKGKRWRCAQGVDQFSEHLGIIFQRDVCFTSGGHEVNNHFFCKELLKACTLYGMKSIFCDSLSVTTTCHIFIMKHHGN